MAAITLDGITLPGDLHWRDEYDWSPVSQTVTVTLTGALIIEEATQLAGRPITLEGADNRAWVSRATVDALRALLTPGREMVLALADGRTFDVTWRHTDRAIDAQPVMFLAPAAAEDFYTLTLRLMEV